MQITIRFFAILREAIGKDTLLLTIENSKPVKEILLDLQEQYPPLKKYADILTFAVNGEYVKPETILKDGDELALLPPISGGSHD